MQTNRPTYPVYSAKTAEAASPAKALRPAAKVSRATAHAPERFARTGNVRITVSPAEVRELTAQRALTVARNELHRISGGSYDSNDVTASRLTVEQRLAYFKSKAVKGWGRRRESLWS